eukprot:1379575-Amphidinium_carterae.1
MALHKWNGPEPTIVNGPEWPACDNACGDTTQQWTRYASACVNHALIGHNDSRHSRAVTGQFWSTSSTLTPLTMTMS